ncbi:flavin-containing monooxygenase FMO GS-OX-like 8 [Exaiptasia diaphana]|uniref:Flavin-containing monooxygenase n=1 Tax=Exaiptasia diaphana TaxID=2652724 RepID=A0A913XM49_EXADI|nr:flavin-containing monooxygenase FMO GS-OX-like 8 [Exaiptasia diaphana]KXJ25606.1 Flavin-containing monooxygenase FMO GS-OX3 [Exaiptasia diaphana]
MSAQKRICVIGAGPSGMSVLYHYNKLKQEGKDVPQIVCYDKQSDWGGLWLYSWETGIDQYGEPVHGSMYRGMWTNNPKEVIELPDYTFQDHFKKPIPSFLPREAMFDYLKGRWSQSDLRQWIKFNHVVRHVTYNDDTDDFSVVVKNLPEDKDLPAQRFDYVIVATGHFSVPNIPYFEGIDQFPGRIIHSHDLRNASQFKGDRILVVGDSFSGVDIAIQTLKYGAKNVIISYRTSALGYKWPSEIEERPLLNKVEGNTVHFKDGSSAEVDSIILCTGYRHHFPFMEESLRLKASDKETWYPPGLYKGVLWYPRGNNKLMYIGMQNQLYVFTMFDIQAKWALEYIVGDREVPDKKTMEADVDNWNQRLNEVGDVIGILDFQTEYVKLLAEEVKYGCDVDCAHMIKHELVYSVDHPLSYKDTCYVSNHSGVKSIKHHTSFMEAFDDSIETFLDTKQ